MEGCLVSLCMVLFLLCPARLPYTAAEETSHSKPSKQLRFREDGTFTLVQLTVRIRAMDSFGTACVCCCITQAQEV